MDTDYLLRRRRRVGTPEKSSDPEDWHYTKEGRKISNYHISATHWIILLVLFGGTSLVTYKLHIQVPLPRDPSIYQDTFSENRISSFLHELSDLGNKPAGSEICESATFNAIKHKLEGIQKSISGTHHSLQIQTQYASGCFPVPKFDTEGFGVCYKNVSNVIARLSPVGSSRNTNRTSLLINCHYDSWPTSDGGSDDLIQCALMIELLTVLSSTTSPSYANDIIFLFNGAEESSLLASHGFITTHPWRHSVRAFINLEASGSGGRELLFQAGPGNQWILDAYLQSAVHPHCSVLGQEIFQSGVYPGDTDFRIFRDYGRVPGLDIAFVQNGYWWHTEFDQAKRISVGSLQRAGDNVLATVRNLMTSKYFNNPADFGEKKFVFFDVLGLFTVVYSMTSAYYFNWALIIIAFTITTKEILGDGSNRSKKSALFCKYILIYIFALLFTLSIVYLTTKLIALLDLSMAWYSEHVYAALFYVIPAIVANYAIYSNFLEYESPLADFHSTVLYFEALLLMAFTAFEIASGFILAIMLFFNLIAHFALKFKKSPKNVDESSVWMSKETILFGVTILTSLPSSLMIQYTLIMVLSIFIPIMGRTSGNSELVIGSFVAITVYFIFLSVLPLLQKTKKSVRQSVIYSLCLGWFVAIALIFFFNQPIYKYSDNFPTVRRTQLYHVHQQTYSKNDISSLMTSKLYVIAQDNRGVADIPFVNNPAVFSHLKSKLASIRFESVHCKDKGKYCQLPYYYPTTDRISPRHIRVAKLDDELEEMHTSMELISSIVEKKEDDFEFYNVTVNVKGSGQMSVVMSSVDQENCLISKWALLDNKLKFTSDSNFAFLTCSGDGCGDWTLNIQITCQQIQLLAQTPAKQANAPQKLVLLTTTSHYMHGPSMMTPLLDDLQREIKKRRLQTPNSPWAMTASGWKAEVLTKYF
uniref:Peptidase_M28 domain-containing protein n=1 Tax=Rhabditophanes sp. KR3021 TaxID=114890 RepID=A0AC35U9F3_9BILA